MHKIVQGIKPHKLTVNDIESHSGFELKLDDKVIENILDYSLEHKALDTAVLTIKLLVGSVYINPEQINT